MEMRIKAALAAAALVSSTVVMAPASAEVLFADTFDRPDADDINASTAGITNTTGDSFGYVENYLGSATAGNPGSTLTNIGGNNLRLADGTGTSNVFLDHNFTDASILAAGGFSVAIDVVEINGNGGAGAGAGFAIGMSRAEAVDTGDALNGGGSSTDDFKMQDGFQAGGANTAADIAVSDFWIVLRQDGFLEFGTRGTALPFTAGVPGADFLGDANAGGNTGTIRVDFTFDSFDAGTAVGYEVFFNGASVTPVDALAENPGTFTWSETGQNFVGLDARGPFVRLDNLSITTPDVAVPEPASLALVGLGGLAALRRRR